MRKLAVGMIIGVALVVVVGVLLWFYGPGRYDMDVPVQMTSTDAAEVWRRVDADEGEPAASVHRRIVEVSLEPTDEVVLVYEGESNELYGLGLYRRDYMFSDRSVLSVYLGENRWVSGVNVWVD